MDYPKLRGYLLTVNTGYGSTLTTILTALTFTPSFFEIGQKTELARVHLAKALAYPGCLTSYLKHGQWKTRSRFQLVADTFRQERWTADFDLPS